MKVFFIHVTWQYVQKIQSFCHNSTMFSIFDPIDEDDSLFPLSLLEILIANFAFWEAKATTV